MVSIGKFGEYNEAKELFRCYVEQLEQYSEVNSVKEAKRRPIFLTVMGSQTYGLLKNLVAPKLPNQSSYEDLVGVLKNHYTLRESTIHSS